MEKNMFKTRLISGIFLVAAAILFFVLGGLPLAVLMLILSGIAFMELSGAGHVLFSQGPAKEGEEAREFEPLVRKTTVPETVGLLTTVLYYGLLVAAPAAFPERIGALQIGCLLVTFFLLMAVYVFRYPHYEAKEIGWTVFSWVYGVLPLSCIYLIREIELNDLGRYLVWLVLLSSWGCDTFAYCAGRLFGKHKMAPILSPKKTVEGAIGGLVGAALLGYLYGLWVYSRIPDTGNLAIMFAVVCFCGGLLSMVGDLAASAIKRNANLKDYGKLIPGHGGVMDRFDSVIFTAPVIYCVISILLYYRSMVMPL